MRRCDRERIVPPWPRLARGESIGDPMADRASAVLWGDGTAHRWQTMRVDDAGRVTRHDPYLLRGWCVVAHLREPVALPDGGGR